MSTNSCGDTFNVGDHIKWCSTTGEHSGTIRKLLADNTALVIGGPYEAVYVHIDSLYF